MLLDTHVLLWWIGNQPISATARGAISEPNNEVSVSAASVWEMAINKAAGKLEVPDDLKDQIARHAFSTLSIDVDHALTAGALPRHHRDPFDRMLIAQAMLEGLTIVTRDRHFAAYGVPVLSA